MRISKCKPMIKDNFRNFFLPKSIPSYIPSFLNSSFLKSLLSWMSAIFPNTLSTFLKPFTLLLSQWIVSFVNSLVYSLSIHLFLPSIFSIFPRFPLVLLKNDLNHFLGWSSRPPHPSSGYATGNSVVSTAIWKTNFCVCILKGCKESVIQ